MAVTTQARPESRPTTEKKWVYLFEEGNKDMRDLLGGKGAGVAEMTRAGLPVPPGFTITTEACNAYYASGKRFPDGMWDQATEALHHVEEKAGKKLGDVKNPLLVSVRSGAKFSMPGMMDTVLKERGKPFPDEPQDQLRAAIEAVFSSWNNKRATDYRNFNKIPHDLGTAVNVQTMVFGNMGNDSGTGVAFTRDPNTGEKLL